MYKLVFIGLFCAISGFTSELKLHKYDLISPADCDDIFDYSCFTSPIALIDWRRLSPDAPHSIAFWDNTSGRWCVRENLPASPALRFEINATGKFWATYENEEQKTIIIHELNNPAHTFKIASDSKIYNFTLHPNGEQIVVLFHDDVITVFDIVTARAQSSYLVHGKTSEQSLLKISPRGDVLLVTDNANAYLIKLGAKLDFGSALSSNYGWKEFNAAAFSRDGAVLVLVEKNERSDGSILNQIHLLDMDNRNKLINSIKSLPLQENYINDIDINPNKTLLAISRAKNTPAEVMDIKGTHVAFLQDYNTKIRSSEKGLHQWQPDSRYCAGVKFLTNTELLVKGQNLIWVKNDTPTRRNVSTLNYWQLGNDDVE